MKVLYLTHDLSDPAVHKRVTMLKDGGATVTVAGFRRTAEPIQSVAGCPVIDFGQTYNGGFGQRLWSVLRQVACIARHRAAFAPADVIIARNLEMLAIAVRGRGLCSPPPALVYECLDIHRLLLKRNPVGAALRWVEGALAKRASALITSSPAFVSGYFAMLSAVRLPVRLMENKVYDPGMHTHIFDKSHRQPGPPWRIGWFGAIRCRKSLAMLTELVRAGNGSIEAIIRGRPDLDQFDDFHQSIQATPGLRFLGPYKNPDELASIYREVHFTWAIDMFEEGLNSSWLLPNRMYEGGLYGSVPIAAASVETGLFIKRLGIGVALAEPKEEALASFFRQLTPGQYRGLETTAMALPVTTWTYDTQDCKDLVAYLSTLTNAVNV